MSLCSPYTLLNIKTCVKLNVSVCAACKYLTTLVCIAYWSLSFPPSEVHAAESVAYLNRALVRLQDIWEEIGIPEEQRVQRTNEVHKHIKVGPK